MSGFERPPARLRPLLRSPASIAWIALLGGLPLGGCDAIVGAGDRKLNPSVTCTAAGCACTVGFGDCDGDPDNGCETSLDDPDNCGACDNVCDNGKCENLACACQPGFAECDGDLTTVCETDVSSDATHCGACTRDCGGATCVDGLCDPQQLASAGTVYNFIVVGKDLYYSPANSPGVWRVDVDGGTPAQVDAGSEFSYLLVHDSGKIYWSSETKIFATDVTTGMTDTLATGEVPALRMGVGGGKVYWGNVDPATMVVSIHRTTTTPGGMVENVAKLLDVKFVNDFAVTSDRVFWNDIDTILSTTHETITASPFQQVSQPVAYFEATPNSLLFTGVPGGTFELPLMGGSAVKLADVEGYGMLASDADHVYFEVAVYGSQDPPALWRASHTGTEPAIKLAEDPFMLPYLEPAIDDKWVYWLSTQSQFVERITK